MSEALRNEQRFIPRVVHPRVWLETFERNCPTVKLSEDDRDELERLFDLCIQNEADDPTIWCNGCGARKQSQCSCGPIAEND